MRQIFGAIAEYEKAMIVAKLRGARQRTKAREGRCEGRKPYGFYEGEGAILERMRAMRAAGATFTAIAEALNAEAVTPRAAGTKWHPGYVHRLLARYTAVWTIANPNGPCTRHRFFHAFVGPFSAIRLWSLV
jgi:DNA invertase Pin-like site-specific DNA recombinase